jgi:DNA-binding transcriptional ArsR family regulator
MRAVEILPRVWLDIYLYFQNNGNMETEAALVALGALAHDSRLALFRLLVTAGPAGLAAGELGERLALPPATASFHLKELRHAGLVSQRRDGRSIYYAADYAAMDALIAYLTENCCQGTTCQPTVAAGSTPAKPGRRKRKTVRHHA